MFSVISIVLVVLLILHTEYINTFLFCFDKTISNVIPNKFVSVSLNVSKSGDFKQGEWTATTPLLTNLPRFSLLDSNWSTITTV